MTEDKLQNLERTDGDTRNLTVLSTSLSSTRSTIPEAAGEPVTLNHYALVKSVAHMKTKTICGCVFTVCE